MNKWDFGVLGNKVISACDKMKQSGNYDSLLVHKFSKSELVTNMEAVGEDVTDVEYIDMLCKKLVTMVKGKTMVSECGAGWVMLMDSICTGILPHLLKKQFTDSAEMKAASKTEKGWSQGETGRSRVDSFEENNVKAMVNTVAFLSESYSYVLTERLGRCQMFPCKIKMKDDQSIHCMPFQCLPPK
ncbi:hypothetical protein PR048_028362 [Dryococelus australis]|uniref:Uncharacterized protein n=1 Tax=Dryococelus australis TaxID=614101 RepID=A0ABQ9GJ42_9NEOP|nr:hypothetical protein PR048_028362 [Dryococelus australis]